VTSEQEHLDVGFAGEHRALQRGARGDDLVRVHALVRIFAEEFFHRLLHGGHARHAADEDDVVDVVRRRELRVVERLLAGLERRVDQVLCEELELGARQRLDDVERLALRRRRDERQIDLRLERRRQLVLRFLGRFLQALERHAIFSKVDGVLLSNDSAIASINR